MKIRHIALITSGLILAALAFWSMETLDEESGITPDIKQAVGTELRKRPTTPLASDDILGAVWIPKSCMRPVMEVMIEDGVAYMGANCQDGRNSHQEFREVNNVDTSVASVEDRGPSFAMVIGESATSINTSGMPQGSEQGVMVEVPILNTCALAAVDVDLSNIVKTTVRYGCLDTGSDSHTTIDLGLNLVSGSTLNKDRSPIVAITLRHPDKVANKN